jgi:hypothetical protein
MRHYYKCADCLSVVATADKVTPAPDCGLCGGAVEYMGEVGRDWSGLQKTRTVSVCDCRCTNAAGPRCDCQCGGVNHGSGRVVEVHYPAGDKPKLRIPPRAEALRVAEEWRAAYASAKARYSELSAKKYGGVYLSAEEFNKWCRIGYALREARGLHTHKARMARLAPWLPVAAAPNFTLTA